MNTPPATPVSSAVFARYLARWNLTVDGDPIVTPRANLLPVRFEGGPAMLKIALYPSETRGNAVMAWWAEPSEERANGASTGAAPVLASDGAAILLARADEQGSLLRLLDQGRDDEAVRVIVDTAAALHAPRTAQPPADLPPLERWFADLRTGAERYGGVLRTSAAAAARLLESRRDRAILHGDLHHENILDFGPAGWLAIDPKGVVGERAFDHVHHLFDPDDKGLPDIDTVERHLLLTADLAGLERSRLRTWLLAWAGLSATWWLDDGVGAAPAVAVAEAMAARLALDRESAVQTG